MTGPELGEIVFYTYAANEQSPNSSARVPAIIVHVWSNNIVNLRLFSDAVPHGAEWRTSVGRTAHSRMEGFWEPKVLSGEQTR